jgi:hypothetical protein
MAHIDELSVWLERDEAESRAFRAGRLEQFLLLFESPVEYVMFKGGGTSHQSYVELRLAFIHGLYFATVILALACIEQELAGALYARGSESPARATLEALLTAAKAVGEIDDGLFSDIDRIRGIRNAYAHFRPPLHPSGLVRRALGTDTTLDELPKADAVDALKVLARFISRF